MNNAYYNTKRSVKDNRNDDFVYDLHGNKSALVKLSTPANVRDPLARSVAHIIASIKELEQHIQELECEKGMNEAVVNSTSDNVRPRYRYLDQTGLIPPLQDNQASNPSGGDSGQSHSKVKSEVINQADLVTRVLWAHGFHYLQNYTNSKSDNINFEAFFTGTCVFCCKSKMKQK